MVKRYDLWFDDMDENIDGDYVTHSDYAGLQSRADALESALIGTLNFITNTESELGVILGCADKARLALAQYGKVK